MLFLQPFIFTKYKKKPFAERYSHALGGLCSKDGNKVQFVFFCDMKHLTAQSYSEFVKHANYQKQK